MVSLITCLKIEGVVKWRGLKSQGPLYTTTIGALDEHDGSVERHACLCVIPQKICKRQIAQTEYMLCVYGLLIACVTELAEHVKSALLLP